ncbi:MAG: hypothetical protein JSS94_06990 [Bacteroidetes bacterium]|nr:hypothetical protein [Bacteroidota bacterium]
MINDEQLNQITQYLLGCKIPIDMLLEVRDHIATQITVGQVDENLTFDQAFQNAKNSWQRDLRPYWNGSWDLEDKNNMVRSFTRSLIVAQLKKAALFGLIPMLLLLVLATVVPLPIYEYIVLSVLSLIVVSSLYLLIRHWKTFQLPRKYPNLILTLHQNYAILPLASAYWFFKMLTEYQTVTQSFYSISQFTQWMPSVFIVILVYVFVVVCLFSYYSQKEYLKRIIGIKPFLEQYA